ncbi:MAG: glycosyltransferase [Saprospiraceae bacterium]|nr:glycosyltransferase [Saprospiraceae bacterium]
MNKSISVIIPNYNGKSLLEKNLPSVYSALVSSQIQDFEIIVCDDASIDDSVIFLKTTYPKIRIVENKINKGFSSNCNSGIRIATKDLVFLMNSDVVLLGEYFTPQIHYFLQEDTFGVMGKIVEENTLKVLDTAKYPALGSWKIGSTTNYYYKEEDTKPHLTLFLSGANALIDRKKIQEMDGFLELFDPYYCEDVDLGIRAWRLGYKLYYEPQSVCIHPISSTIKKENAQKVVTIAACNKITLHALHLPTLMFEIYFIKTQWKAIALKLGGNPMLWHSLQLFREKSILISEATKRIKIEQDNKNCNRTIIDIKRIILADIGSKKYELF